MKSIVFLTVLAAVFAEPEPAADPKLNQKLILTTMELMDMDMLDIHMPTTHTQLTIMERDLLMLNQKLNQKQIHTMLPTMDMDIHMPITHTLLTTLERDLLMLNQLLNQRLIHTM